MLWRGQILKIKKFKVFREFGILVALFVMVIIFTAINPIYISFNNIIDIVQQSAINGLIAIGITFAILTAGIDLSVGSSLAIVIVVVGKFLTSGVNPIFAIIIGVLIGFLLGVFNGLLITKLKIQPFVATLGTMSVYRGIAYVITGGWPVLNMPRDFRNLVSGRVFNIIPIPIFILIGFAIITHILLNHTRFGTYVYSIGGNEEATRLSGVNVEKNKVLAYGLVGVGAALAALVLLARLGTGEPTAGQGYELDAIAAAAIGGTSLAGGKGSVLGTFLGAILLSALKVGLIVTGVDTFWQFIATGSIIIIAVYLEHVQSQLYKK